MRIRLALLLALAIPLGAAAETPPAGPAASGAESATPLAVAQSARPVVRPFIIPTARWDKARGTRPWTMAALSALRTHARTLPRLVPRDIGAWCPGYRSADRAGREAFWVGLVSSLAWHESTHRPRAVGGGGRWYGLVQIYPPTARLYDCRAQSGEALKNPERNLQCGLRIMAKTVARDGVISEGMRGVAADWGPFHSSRKREDMRDWVRRQPYCRGLARSLRPNARPAPEGPMDPAAIREAQDVVQEMPQSVPETPGEGIAPEISTQDHDSPADRPETPAPAMP